MIEIYVKTNTNYNKNGDITLTPSSCTYKDSEKELVLEHFQDADGRWKYIEFENVIAAEENGKKKLYRIYNVIRSLHSVTAYARPIFYDLIDTVLLDVRPTEKNGQEALNIILADTGFKGHSNILSLNTAYYVRKNIVEALVGDDNSFINRWGGEFYCENFDVYINDKIGSDNGIKIELGYNLNEIEEDVNVEEVVTRIVPVGYDGLILDGTSWVDSPLINKYTKPKMRVIEFSDVKVKNDSTDEEGFETIEEARAELVRQCKMLFEGGIDKPSINYKIDMINLANTTEYENFKMLVNVNKGDTVTCYIPHLDIDVKARVIDYEKDLLTGEYISIELGNVTNDFFKDQSDIQNKVDNIFNNNGNVKAETLEGAINALQTKFEALRDVAQPQQVRAILFEDRIEDSPTFGCMCLGTMGFEIASEFKPGTTEWNFRTFGTGKGFVADYIIAGVLNAALIKAGILQSENGNTWIDMESGTFNFANKVKFDGSTFSVDLSGEDLSTNESMKAIIKVLNDSISTKVSNGDFSTYKEQTAEHIKTEVKNVKEGLESNISQTAGAIRGEITDTKNGLQSQINWQAGEISSKVSNGTFESYKTQTANEISSKVSSGNLGTLVQQSAEHWGLSIWGKLYGTNYRFDGNNFSIGTTDGNDRAYHASTYSRWNHHDGSYTQVSSSGLEHYTNGERQPYHYMFDIVVVDASHKCNGTWFRVQLPHKFRGKNFTLAWQMGNGSVSENRVWSGHQVDVRNIDHHNATCEISVTIYSKGKFSGGMSADAGAYGWAKLFIIY